MLLTVFIGWWSLAVQAMPAGLHLCLERNGHLALEWNSDACCLGSVVAPPDAGRGSHEAVECIDCFDLDLPHDQALWSAGPVMAGEVPRAIWPLVAQIVWTAGRPLPPPGADRDLRPPAHLIHAATIVILG